MANTFEIANANPLRLVLQGVTSPYLLRPFDLKQETQCYQQKFATSDVIVLQILSDFVDIEFNVYDLYTNELKFNFPAVDTLTNILDQTFKCYQIDIQFPDEGQYYCELTYTNELPQQVLYQSEPIYVLETHEKTMLIEYKNSENDFGVIFDTDITFRIRVEGTIAEFKPEFDETVYNDQQRNATKLYALPYRSFKLYIGNAGGVPDWLIDKVNSALVCDTVMIEGVYHERIEGSKWEAKRADPDGTPFVGWSTDIMPVENFFLQRLKTGPQPPEGYTQVEKVKNYYGNAADLIIGGVFKKYSLLKNITIIRYGDVFDLTVGTTPGGSEIGTFPITEDDTNLSVHWPFRAIQTVYLGGLTGTNNDILLDYLQYDEIPVNGSGGATVVAPSFPLGFIGIYEPVAGRAISVDFNLATGLGNAGTPYANCAICDGRNGTIDRGGRVSVAYLGVSADYGIPGATGGQESVTLTVAQMPNHSHTYNQPQSSNNVSNGGVTRFTHTPSLANTSLVGGGQSHPNMQPFIVDLWFKAIS